MHKLASLREHLIKGPLKIKAAQLDIYATKGGVRSARGEHNQDFELVYTAHVLLRDYTGDPDALVYLVLGWLDQNQPGHTDQPMQWEADILNHKSADVYLAVPLTETISVNPVEGGIELRHETDPALDPVLLPAAEWSLYLRGEPDPIATWLAGSE